MKKATLAIFLAGICVCAFAQNGVIKDLTGTVELRAAGASAFSPATAGAQIMADTIISTGFKSTALVEVGSVVIAVRPLTRLTLTEISAMQGAETLTMNLQAGRVRVDVNPPAGIKASVSVSSPTATASVRGTSFYFDTMNVSVLEGTVAFKGNIGYTVQVGAGSFSGIGPYNVATVPQSNSTIGLVPPSPAGYDQAATTGTTGGTGVVPSSPSEPVSPPTKPPSGGGSSNSGGGGSKGGGGTTSGGPEVGIDFEY